MKQLKDISFTYKDAKAIIEQYFPDTVWTEKVMYVDKPWSFSVNSDRFILDCFEEWGPRGGLVDPLEDVSLWFKFEDIDVPIKLTFTDSLTFICVIELLSSDEISFRKKYVAEAFRKWCADELRVRNNDENNPFIDRDIVIKNNIVNKQISDPIYLAGYFPPSNDKPVHTFVLLIEGYLTLSNYVKHVKKRFKLPKQFDISVQGVCTVKNTVENATIILRFTGNDNLFAELNALPSFHKPIGEIYR